MSIKILEFACGSDAKEKIKKSTNQCLHVTNRITKRPSNEHMERQRDGH